MLGPRLSFLVQALLYLIPVLWTATTQPSLPPQHRGSVAFRQVQALVQGFPAASHWPHTCWFISHRAAHLGGSGISELRPPEAAPSFPWAHLPGQRGPDCHGSEQWPTMEKSSLAFKEAQGSGLTGCEHFWARVKNSWTPYQRLSR